MSAPIRLPINPARVVAYLAPDLPTYAATRAAVPPDAVLVCMTRGGEILSVPDAPTFGTLRGGCVMYAVPPWVTGPQVLP